MESRKPHTQNRVYTIPHGTGSKYKRTSFDHKKRTHEQRNETAQIPQTPHASHASHVSQTSHTPHTSHTPRHAQHQPRVERMSQVTRNTSETNIVVKLTVDGKGENKIRTGISFLDHMLTLFSKHGYFDLELNAKGDLDVDIHHTNEDVGITLGEAFAKALGDKKGIQRYGFFYVPMEEALARVVVDISNRPCLCIDGIPEKDIRREKGSKQYSYYDAEHFFKSFCQSAGLNMHISILKGNDRHHVLEAVFKALGRALDRATKIDRRNGDVPSTKGIL